MRRVTALGCSFALIVGALGAPAIAAEDPPIKAVLWVGGFAHDFDAFAAISAEFLPQKVPVALTVARDGSFLDAEPPDVILMNHCFEKAEGVLTEAQRLRLLELVRGGVGVVAVHASYYSFLDWEAVHELFGPRFTQHGSSEVSVTVRLTDREHPIARGLPETFSVRTELYESTPLPEDCHLLAMAREEGKPLEHPSVWTREYGHGRVVTILPAHWPEAYQVPEFQQLIANSVLWAPRREIPRRDPDGQPEP